MTEGGQSPEGDQSPADEEEAASDSADTQPAERRRSEIEEVAAEVVDEEDPQAVASILEQRMSVSGRATTPIQQLLASLRPLSPELETGSSRWLKSTPKRTSRPNGRGSSWPRWNYGQTSPSGSEANTSESLSSSSHSVWGAGLLARVRASKASR